MPGQPVFYYDLGDPECYLVAERIMTRLDEPPEWEPVLASEIGAVAGTIDRARIERDAQAQGLMPMVWPAQLPADTRQAMLAATYAKRVGRAVAFSLAAFRQTFAAGRDLGEESTVLLAGAATEMHPAALLKGIALRSVTAALDTANERARGAGVRTLPALEIDGRLLTGESIP